MLPLSLDAIGIIEGTDKSSLIGDYLRHYQDLFAEYRNQPINVLELGVFRGASTRMWSRFFSKARVIGVDIDEKCRQYASDRVIIEIGSQDDPEFLHQIVGQYPPTIIIDDGSHRADHIIFSFERLFPVLLPGGYYAVEDLHFHMREAASKRLRGGASASAADYFTELSRLRLRDRNDVPVSGLPRHLHAAIDHLRFIRQAVIMRKSAATEIGCEEVREYVRASRSPLNWLFYCFFLQRAGRPVEEQVQALITGAQLPDAQPVIFERLSELLQRRGDLDGAIAAIDRATDLLRNEPARHSAVLARGKALREAKDKVAAP